MTRRVSRWILCIILLASAWVITARPAPAAEAPPSAAAGAAKAAASVKLSLAEVFFIQRHPVTHEVEWFGSIIIWTLMALSAASLGLMGVLWRDNARRTIIPDGLAGRLRELLRERRAPFAADVAAQTPSFLGEVMRAALVEAGSGHIAITRAMESASEELTIRRLRRTEPLNVIGNIAPMIGLFGTVYGIILAFRAIVSAGGTPDPVALAAGIGTALVATFWGLVVAIPALSAYAVLRGRIDGMTLEATRAAEELIGVLRNAPPAPSAGAAGKPSAPSAAEAYGVGAAGGARA
ncbi:MAG TPA: MotA/TolQ/ExbB proton channel family protein [Phycisphaerales bacterium]|nr:MotA/TolQ/ExbB proton channel family protein [Phycisphaerales bacterium]